MKNTECDNQMSQSFDRNPFNSSSTGDSPLRKLKPACAVTDSNSKLVDEAYFGSDIPRKNESVKFTTITETQFANANAQTSKAQAIEPNHTDIGLIAVLSGAAALGGGWTIRRLMNHERSSTLATNSEGTVADGLRTPPTSPNSRTEQASHEGTPQSSRAEQQTPLASPSRASSEQEFVNDLRTGEMTPPRNPYIAPNRSGSLQSRFNGQTYNSLQDLWASLQARRPTLPALQGTLRQPGQAAIETTNDPVRRIIAHTIGELADNEAAAGAARVVSEIIEHPPGI